MCGTLGKDPWGRGGAGSDLERKRGSEDKNHKTVSSGSTQSCSKESLLPGPLVIGAGTLALESRESLQDHQPTEKRMNMDKGGSQ